MTPIVAPDPTRATVHERRATAGPTTSCAGSSPADKGSELYSRHQWMGELVIADIKQHRRAGRFKRRGRAAVRSELRLIAATHNLLKLHRHSLATAAA